MADPYGAQTEAAATTADFLANYETWLGKLLRADLITPAGYRGYMEEAQRAVKAGRQQFLPFYKLTTGDPYIQTYTLEQLKQNKEVAEDWIASEEKQAAADAAYAYQKEWGRAETAKGAIGRVFAREPAEEEEPLFAPGAETEGVYKDFLKGLPPAQREYFARKGGEAYEKFGGQSIMDSWWSALNRPIEEINVRQRVTQNMANYEKAMRGYERYKESDPDTAKTFLSIAQDNLSTAQRRQKEEGYASREKAMGAYYTAFEQAEQAGIGAPDIGEYRTRRRQSDSSRRRAQAKRKAEREALKVNPWEKWLEEHEEEFTHEFYGQAPEARRFYSGRFRPPTRFLM